VKELEGWVTSWSRVKEIREFVVALETLSSFKGEDVSESSPQGQRLIWMRQQADRVDPLVESPPSVVDADMKSALVTRNSTFRKSPMLFGIWQALKRLRLVDGKVKLLSREHGQISWENSGARRNRSAENWSMGPIRKCSFPDS
jgi:hypothetical protein